MSPGPKCPYHQSVHRTKVSLGTKSVPRDTKVSLGIVPRDKVSFVPRGFGTVGGGGVRKKTLYVSLAETTILGETAAM